MLFLIEDSEYQNKFGLQILYFYGSWISEHRKMLVMLEMAEKKYPGNYYAIDVDYFKTLCRRFQIKNVPTVVFTMDGKEKARITQIITTSELISILVDICKDKETLTLETNV